MDNTKKMLCFDMDGTIVDLYGVEGWLGMLRAEDVTPYVVAKPLWDMTRLNSILNQLIEKGWEIRVITWLAKNGSPEYNKAVRKAKRDWLENHFFPVHKCHMVVYGTTKANCIRRHAEPGANIILVDDNSKVANGWTIGQTIDPTKEDLLHALTLLLRD